MGSLNQKNISQLAIIGFAFVVVSLSFNNCGGVGSMPNATALSQMSYVEKVDALTRVHQGHLPANFCADSRNYSCLHKVFSSKVTEDDFKNAEAICTPLTDGIELCPTTADFLYSTSAAKATCTDNCNGDLANGFDTEEFECHLKLSLQADGIYPLVASKKDFNSSIEKIYQSCLAIQKGLAQ